MFSLFILAFTALAVAEQIQQTPHSGGHLMSVFKECEKTYKVVAGDICYAIAPTHGLTVESLIALNENLDCDKLMIGQEICVSNGEDTMPGCKKRYTVVEGDICFDIAAKYSLSLSKFYEMNPGIKCNELIINQQICLSYHDNEDTGSIDIGIMPVADPTVGNTPANDAVSKPKETDTQSVISPPLKDDDAPAEVAVNKSGPSEQKSEPAPKTIEKPRETGPIDEKDTDNDDLPPPPQVAGDDGALAAHNRARADVGTRALSWSSSLSSSAKSYANVLASRGCQLIHSEAADIGENLYAVWGGTRTMAHAVQKWVDEKYEWDGRSYNHYTQVVWRSTSQVGCAISSGSNCQVVVCHYKAPGNWLGEKPF